LKHQEATVVIFVIVVVVMVVVVVVLVVVVVVVIVVVAVVVEIMAIMLDLAQVAGPDHAVGDVPYRWLIGHNPSMLILKKQTEKPPGCSSYVQ